MGDGWETKRSRQKGHKDWAIIKLGDGGYLTHVEIDTSHFKGNFPESCELHAIETPDVIPSIPDDKWKQVLPRTKLGPHRQHFFQLENTLDTKYTHLKVTIHPDGGLKRIRVIGTQQPIPRNGNIPMTELSTPIMAAPAPAPESIAKSIPTIRTLPALPLTPEAFDPFGKVIQGYSDLDAVPPNTKVTSANQASAIKFHKLSILESSYPKNSEATTGLSVYRCQPIDVQLGGVWDVKLLERHRHTNQAFIPMAGGNVVKGGESLEEYARSYLVIVAKNGENDGPDLQSMRAFIASAGQGIVYDTGIWHHPMAVLEKPLDLTCVETQVGDGGELDCEVVDLDITETLYKVKIPEF